MSKGGAELCGVAQLPSPLQHPGTSICNPAACLSLPDLQPLTKTPTVVQSLWGNISHLIFLCCCSHGFAFSSVMTGSSLEAIAPGVRITPSALFLFTPYFVAFGLR